MARRGLRRLAWIGAGVAGGVLLLGLVFMGLTADLQPDEGDSNATYSSGRVELGDLNETVVASGTMEPLVRVSVISEVSGIIERVHVEAGDRVTRGQPLFELDRERLQARVAERRAELRLREANARYDLIGRAQAELDQARRDRARVAELRERSVSSELELERMDHELRLAKISLNDAHAAIAARQAAVEQARELLRQANRDLENALIRAPVAGVVIERDGEVGRAVADVTRNGGTVIAVIADDRRIRLVAEVDENEIARVRVGQSAEVTLDAFPGERFHGVVRKISVAGSTEGNISNFEIEVELLADVRFRVGMSSDARVVVHEHRGVLLVPNIAIARRKDGPMLRIPDVSGRNGAYTLRPIEMGYSDGFQTVVFGGVSEGDVILVPESQQ